MLFRSPRQLLEEEEGEEGGADDVNHGTDVNSLSKYDSSIVHDAKVQKHKDTAKACWHEAIRLREDERKILRQHHAQVS